MSNQQGATLAVTLLMLLIITLLGISAIQVTHMQEKMTANLQDKELSFHAAESALAAGETWILAQAAEPPVTTTCSAFPCVQTAFQNFNVVGQSSTWWQSNSANYNTQLDNVATTPRYIIEFLQFVPDTPVVGTTSSTTGVYYYQVTARGSGGSNDSFTILQTTVARRF
jgi:type IV pilus assembly protein PilX